MRGPQKMLCIFWDPDSPLRMGIGTVYVKGPCRSVSLSCYTLEGIVVFGLALIWI